jgi:type II secretory pathway predicted ATPase ExeA/HAMP domain-containing protein
MTEFLGLDEDVESHFGFREAPFGVTPDPRFFYSNPVYVKALAALVYGIKAKKGFMLLTGEVGTGKTILLRKLMRNLEPTVQFVFVSASHLTSYGLVELMVQDLGLASKEKPGSEMIHVVHGYLLRQLRNGHTVALLIDEAQNLSDGALEGLCDLSNLETDNEKLLQIVLVGQPELETKLSKPSMRRIKQRIAIQHRLCALQTMDEVEHYIRHRLHVAGYDGPEIFTKEALEAIWLYSAGTPRLVNIICDNSLALACEAANKKASAYMVMKAASGFQLERGAEVPEIGAPEIAVAPTAEINSETETNKTEVKIGDRSEAPEIAGAPTARINPETETNGTEVKMGDRSEAPEIAVAPTAEISPETETNETEAKIGDRSEAPEIAVAPTARINSETETNKTEAKIGDRGEAPEIAVAPTARINSETETNKTEAKMGDRSEAPEIAVAPTARINPETETNETEAKMGDRSEAPEIAVAPTARINSETETNKTEAKMGDRGEAPEIAVAPTARINPETERNGTEAKMGDRSEAPPVSLRAPEPVAVSPTEANPPAVSPEFFDHRTHAATEAMAPMSDDQITARGESRDTFRRKKLGELTALLGRVNETRFQTRVGLKWKIGGAFTGVMLILCTFVAAAAYQIIQHTLRDQFDKRALAIATNLSDAAAGHIVGKNLLGLNALIRKYTLLDGVAYAFIEDGKGDIVAQTLGTFPPELRQGLPVGGPRLAYQRELSLQKKTVYETSVPVLEGQVGIVHVGFWADAMEKEIQRALLPLIGIIAIVPFIGALLSFLVAHWFVRPIVRLTEAAEKVTRGDLEAGGECVQSRDEIGDLARSLERMRASLKAAMLRLGRA